MDRAWRSISPVGVVGLIHPESHFTEARAGGLRRQTYRRLRRHWQFRNVLLLFEVDNGTEYGLHIYGQESTPNFLSASSLYHPDTIVRSMIHDGSGPEPGLRDAEDRWDLSPHRGRVVRVDRPVLANWAGLIEEPGTSTSEARMLYPVNSASQVVLDKLAQATRFGAVDFKWTSGWNETNARQAGYFQIQSAVPREASDVILQGPHFTVATPYARQPRPTMKSNKDYDPWDLEALSERALPRTNYQRAKTPDEYLAGYPRWDGRPSNQFFRLAWRVMVDSTTVRSLHAALIPPGPTHIHGVSTLATGHARDTAIAAGMWASVVVDFLVKVSGTGHVQAHFAERFPHPIDHPLAPELILRALRLNCLTADYSALWGELTTDHLSAWQADSWTLASRLNHPFWSSVGEIGAVDAEWSMTTPLRRDAERRQALVEIDALAAVMLGITAEELCAIYRTQFGVLRKYERVMQMDANGRQVPNDVLKSYAKNPDKTDLTRAAGGVWQPPFTPVDREAEMTVAHAEFSRRAAER